jgi:hypothetical protein
MHYFPSWSPDFINTMTWANFTLYLASIPDFSSDNESGKEKIEVKDASELF